jgi:hypothetical protein
MSAPYSGRFSTYLCFSRCGFPVILVCPALLENYCEILHLLINKTGPERRTWHNLGRNRVICHNLITDTNHPEGYPISDRKSAIFTMKEKKREEFPRPHAIQRYDKFHSHPNAECKILCFDFPKMLPECESCAV